MKRGIFLATFLMTAAGVASANLLTTGPQPVPSPWPQAQPATQARPATEVPPPAVARSSASKNVVEMIRAQPAPTPQAAPKVTASHSTHKALAEAQAPVPFRMKPRPPVNLPHEKATEAKAAGKSAETSSDPASGDDAGESAARAAIEADGYKGVKVLRKGASGVWHASALRGKTTVMLTVDASGSVSAD